MEKGYVNLVRLLIEAAPAVFEGSHFAMKGGTAINLFVADMPRLSVDIDLVFADHRVGRNEALQSIADALASMRSALARQGIDPATGFFLLTARCSYELVDKTIIAGCPLLVTISAPTTLAVERAKAHGLTLVGLARPDAILLVSGSLAAD